jgi:hypothetical protein
MTTCGAELSPLVLQRTRTAAELVCEDRSVFTEEP